MIERGTPTGMKGATEAVNSTVLLTLAYRNAISIGWPSKRLLASS